MPRNLDKSIRGEGTAFEVDPPEPSWLDPPRPCGHEWRNNDFVCMDCTEARIADLERELNRAKAEIADYEQTDLVPRSRYKALEADWQEAREQVRRVVDKAAVEIGRLEKENATLRGGK